MNTPIPNSAPRAISAAGDDRRGLGYGLIQQRFHKPRSSASTFPFVQEDQLEDEDDFEIDEETLASVGSKTLKLQKNDPSSPQNIDTLYYVGTATKLRACFERPDDVLEEIGHIAKGAVPIPRFYKKGFTEQAVDGYSTTLASFSASPRKKTRIKKGLTTIHPKRKIEVDQEHDLDSKSYEFFNLSDLADIQRPSLGECFLFHASYLTNAI